MKTTPHVIVVAGPTSSGKSDFAVDLALKHNGEIISADSCQIYRGLNIGTGKITQEEMRGVPHHMIDIIDINDSFSVEEYRSQALSIINTILTNGKTPIICGGTGQYIDALIFEESFPKVPPNKKLREELETKSVEDLYTQLENLDKDRAADIDFDSSKTTAIAYAPRQSRLQVKAAAISVKVRSASSLRTGYIHADRLRLLKFALT